MIFRLRSLLLAVSLSGCIVAAAPPPQGPGAPPPGAGGPLSMEPGVNRAGNDYHDMDLPEPDPELCRQECARDPHCAAFTYVKPGEQGASARCWLKNPAPAPAPSDCCSSGAR